MASLKDIANIVQKSAYKRFINKRELVRLAQLDNPVCESLSKAIGAAIIGEISAEEELWINKIESIREELKASNTEIQITDYGAGSPDSNLSAEEMYGGREVARTIGEVCRSSSKPRVWAFLLFRVIRGLRPGICLELGTCLGISAAYQAAALKVNNHGRIATLEGDETLASLSRKNFERLGLDNAVIIAGRFQDTLEKALHENNPVDFAFIDGHHEEKATLFYFEQIHPFLSENAIVVFDDIAWSKGMERAWKIIREDGRVMVSVDFFSVGMVIFDSRSGGKKSFKILVE